MKKALSNFKKKLQIPKSKSLNRLEYEPHKERELSSSSSQFSEAEKDKISKSIFSADIKTIQDEFSRLKNRRFKVSDFARLSFPNYAECVPVEKQYNFILTCRVCCVVFSFAPGIKNPEYLRARHTKTQLLIMLSNFAHSDSAWFDKDCLQATVDLITTNLFFPPIIPSEPEPVGDKPTFSEWEHHQPIFSFLLALISNTSTRTGSSTRLSKLYKKRFIRRMLRLLYSPNGEERNMAQRVVHRLYSKNSKCRTIVRTLLGDFIDECITHKREFPGLNELLVFISSYTCGFMLPLKEEHVRFFRSKILPLYLHPFYPNFSIALKNCVSEFVNKREDLGIEVAISVLHIIDRREAEMHLLWNKDRSVVTGVGGENRVRLLNFIRALDLSLEIVLSSTLKSNRSDVASEIVEGVAKCICDMNLLVTENALSVLENNNFRKLIQMDVEKNLGVIINAMKKNESHWSYITREKSSSGLACLKIVFDKDIERLSEISSLRKKKEEEKASQRLEQWMQL